MAAERLHGTPQELLACFLDGPKDVLLGPRGGGRCREVQEAVGEGCDTNVVSIGDNTTHSI